MEVSAEVIEIIDVDAYWYARKCGRVDEVAEFRAVARLGWCESIARHPELAELDPATNAGLIRTVVRRRLVDWDRTQRGRVRQEGRRAGKMAWKAHGDWLHLDSLTADDEGGSFLDFAFPDPNVDVEAEAVESAEPLSLEPLIESLLVTYRGEKRERMEAVLRGVAAGVPLAVIAEWTGVSESRVSQFLGEVAERFRDYALGQRGLSESGQLRRRSPVRV